MPDAAGANDRCVLGEPEIVDLRFQMADMDVACLRDMPFALVLAGFPDIQDDEPVAALGELARRDGAG